MDTYSRMPPDPDPVSPRDDAPDWATFGRPSDDPRWRAFWTQFYAAQQSLAARVLLADCGMPYEYAPPAEDDGEREG